MRIIFGNCLIPLIIPCRYRSQQINHRLTWVPHLPTLNNMYLWDNRNQNVCLFQFVFRWHLGYSDQYLFDVCVYIFEGFSKSDWCTFVNYYILRHNCRNCQIFIELVSSTHLYSSGNIWYVLYWCLFRQYLHNIHHLPYLK